MLTSKSTNGVDVRCAVPRDDGLVHVQHHSSHARVLAGHLTHFVLLPRKQVRVQGVGATLVTVNSKLQSRTVQLHVVCVPKRIQHTLKHVAKVKQVRPEPDLDVLLQLPARRQHTSLLLLDCCAVGACRPQPLTQVVLVPTLTSLGLKREKNAAQRNLFDLRQPSAPTCHDEAEELL